MTQRLSGSDQAATSVTRALQHYASPQKAKSSAWFFKTDKGQYGEGDEFLGVTVPEQRQVARQFRDLPLSEIAALLDSKIHEHRLTALFILVGQFERTMKEKIQPGTPRVEPGSIVEFYLTHRSRVNNWDLVDSSAPQILGAWLLHQEHKQILYDLARSSDLWERRTAMIATYTSIKAGEFEDALKIAEILVHDSHDLIHKAVGWMLREVGNRDRVVLEEFLNRHAAAMPRTMLRYAIEKFEPALRKRYLAMKKG